MLKELNEKIATRDKLDLTWHSAEAYRDCRCMLEKVIEQIEALTPDGCSANYDDGFRLARDTAIKLLKGE